MAVCLLPGTELSFAEQVRQWAMMSDLGHDALSAGSPGYVCHFGRRQGEVKKGDGTIARDGKQISEHCFAWFYLPTSERIACGTDG
jgi:hypothetical protein